MSLEMSLEMSGERACRCGVRPGCSKRQLLEDYSGGQDRVTELSSVALSPQERPDWLRVAAYPSWTRTTPISSRSSWTTGGLSLRLAANALPGVTQSTQPKDERPVTARRPPDSAFVPNRAPATREGGER